MSLHNPLLKKLIKSLQPYFRWLILIAGISIPAIVITLFPKLFHGSDVDDFWRWSQAWGGGWENIYVTCDRCNYPFLGTFISGGVMSLMGIENFKEIVAPFRYYLAVIDGLNVLAVYFIITKLGIKNALVWAGVIGLLPSSWIGSSVWGQIDGVGQFLILAMFSLFIWFNLNGRIEGRRYYFFLTAAGLLISCILLTKQLIFFSLFSLGFMTLANILLYSRKPIETAVSCGVVVFALLAPILLIDSILNLKAPYFSHLQYVLETGSKQGDTVSSFGFNIWIFLVDNPQGSSHAAVDIIWGAHPLFSVTPYEAGIFLFVLINAFLLFCFIQYFRKQYKNGIRFFDREGLLVFLLHLALVNLSFNLFLAGTHERYLYHFYPFIIVACLGLFNRNVVYILLATGTFYGLILYGYLTRLNVQFGQIPYQLLGIIHSALFIYLIAIVLRFFRSKNSGEAPQQ